MSAQEQRVARGSEEEMGGGKSKEGGGPLQRGGTPGGRRAATKNQP